jgi:hypothetical protein
LSLYIATACRKTTQENERTGEREITRSWDERRTYVGVRREPQGPIEFAVCPSPVLSFSCLLVASWDRRESSMTPLTRYPADKIRRAALLI